jgi:hypothetical protein
MGYDYTITLFDHAGDAFACCFDINELVFGGSCLAGPQNSITA